MDASTGKIEHIYSVCDIGHDVGPPIWQEHKGQAPSHIVGGVDTHKDFQVAAVLDQNDRLLGSRSSAAIRQ